jgi:hypothetical protein
MIVLGLILFAVAVAAAVSCAQDLDAAPDARLPGSR